MYFLELENKEKINARISVPVGILSLLIGGVFYLLTVLKDIENSIWYCIFLSFFSIFVISLIIAVIYTAKAYYNYEYKYLPSLSDLSRDASLLEEYVDEIIKYNGTAVGQNERKNMIEEEIKRDQYNKFIKATDINIGLNEKNYSI